MPHYNHPLIIIKNPNSTTHARVESEVLTPLVRNNIPFDTYDTQYPSAADNTSAMVRDLPKQATIISATGDGTSGQVTNAAIDGGKDWHIGYLPYGNFNDLANAHMNRQQTVLDMLGAPLVATHPLSIAINGEHQRYVPSYITLGLTSLIAAEFDTQNSRQNIRALPTRRQRLVKSFTQAASGYWHFKNTTLPAFRANNGEVQTSVTDIAISNNPIVAGILRSQQTYYDTSYFGARTDLTMSHMGHAALFSIQALAGHTPLYIMHQLRLDFESSSSLPIRTDGEPLHHPSVSSIDITKDPTITVPVLHPKK